MTWVVSMECSLIAALCAWMCRSWFYVHVWWRSSWQVSSWWWQHGKPLQTNSSHKICQVRCGVGESSLTSHNFLEPADIFQQFTVKCKQLWVMQRLWYCQVSCGGCHTLVIARPRPESDAGPQEMDGMLELAEQSSGSEKLPTISEMIRRGELSNSLDMSGSISARIRRRQKMPVMALLLQ